MFRKVFIGGNWKSNGDLKFIKDHMNKVVNVLNFDTSKAEVVIAPTNIHISYVRSLLSNNNIQISAQNVSAYPEGAYTGEVSAKALLDSGINWSLIGHSERRQYFVESDDVVNKKIKISIANNLNVIACIGENLREREENQTMNVCLTQLDAVANAVKDASEWNRLVIAYEPVWAIGTGKTATKEQAQEVHGNLRNHIEKNIGKEIANNVRIIYGGSVTDSNAVELIVQKDIDGFLVGGASLKPAFIKIVEAYKNQNI